MSKSKNEILKYYKPHNIVIYTDASLNDEREIAACGYMIMKNGNTVKTEIVILGGIVGSHMAEIFAIKHALIEVRKHLKRVGRIKIYTDSKSVTVATNAHSPVGYLVRKELKPLMRILRESNIIIDMEWVRGHHNNQHNRFIDQFCRKELREYLKNNPQQ